MTRADARMVAEELHNIMLQNGEIKDEYLTKGEASKIYKVPTSHFDNYGYQYPRKKMGRQWIYSRNGIEKKLRS